MAVFFILFCVVFGGVFLMSALALMEHIWTISPDEIRSRYVSEEMKPLRLKRNTCNDQAKGPGGFSPGPTRPTCSAAQRRD